MVPEQLEPVGLAILVEKSLKTRGQTISSRSPIMKKEWTCQDSLHPDAGYEHEPLQWNKLQVDLEAHGISDGLQNLHKAFHGNTV